MINVMLRTELIKYFLLLFLLICQKSYSQTDFYFEVVFKDKGSAYNVNSPAAFLSDQSIQKKNKRNIPVDELDLPLNVSDLQSLAPYTISVTHHSKWRNSVLIKTVDTTVVDQIRKLSNVKSVQFFTAKSNSSPKKEFKADKFAEQINFLSETYARSYNQITMIRADFLHERGFKGEDMNIAIFDAGFNPEYFSVIEELQSVNQIKYTWDFVDNDTTVFEKHMHGAMVLSVMAHNNAKVRGTAPHANYFLFITEDNNSETLLEEYNWLMAAERADSIGVDVINSSLGYFLFDDSTTNHSYSDMDGKTTLVTKAANIAVRKGIFVVASAGNEAQDPWHYIISPADADSVLAVAAVDAKRNIAAFSSVGPSSDGEVKPNVAAQGLASVITYYQNNYITASGTSFSGPIMAGAAACLWQAFPELSNLQLKKEIEKCASQYNSPDSLLGYGIPDLMKAYMNLDSYDKFNYDQSLLISIRTNPFTDRIGVEMYSAEKKDVSFKLMDITGRLIREETQSIEQNQYLIFGLGNLNGLSSGVYIFMISAPNEEGRVWKVLKN